MKSLRALRLLIPIMGLLALSEAANAACSTPQGAAGDMTYSTSANIMAYCDGTNWISMNGGVSLTVNTSGGGVTPYGSAGDVQINGGGALSGDTGKFTYSANTLSAPIVSASTINSGAINNTGLATVGSIFDNGGLTVMGVASITQVSTTTLSAAYASTTLLQIGSGAGASCSSGINGALRYNSTSGTIDICTGTSWTSLASGTITGSGISGGSATAIAFWNGPSSLTYESTTTSGLYWDHTNGRLGVGNNTPGAGLDVSSSSGNIWVRKGTGGPLSASAGQGIKIESSANGGIVQSYDYVGSVGMPLLLNATGGNVGVGVAANNSITANLQVSGTFVVSQTGQNSLASASLAVDARGVSVSSIVHITGSPISPIGGGGNAILSGTTAVSTSSAGSITFYAGGARRMTIGSTGNVGIGASVTPWAPLLVNTPSGTNANIVLGRAANTDQAMYVSYPAGALSAANPEWLWGLQGGESYFNISTWNGTTGNERLIVDTSGNVVIGGSSASPNPGVAMGPGGYLTIGHANGTASGTGFQYFAYNGGTIGTITQNGTTAVAYNTTSDRRVKENIADTREGLQKLMRIGVKDFSFKADPSHTIVNGFIAQDLYKTYPEAVTTNGDNGETPLKDKSKIWQVDYGRVTPLIVKAVQDLKHLFDSDHAEVEKLKAQLKAANDNIQTLGSEVETLGQEVRQLRQQK